jgi:cyclic pyranopterin phosphate synthase
MSPPDGGLDLRRMSRSLPIVDAQPQPRGRALPRRSAYALRVSVLDACNLRCGYCAPGALQAPMPARRWLSAGEHAVVAAAFAGVAVRKVRFTGGEPTLRPDLVDVVATWRQAMPTAEVAMTTNGLKLTAIGASLVRAGLERVTVHVDTLRASRHQMLMGGGDGDLARVLDGISHMQGLGVPVKLNVVVQRGKNDDELRDFLAFSRRTSVPVRFIELMRTGSANDVVDDALVTGAAIVAAVSGVRVDRAHVADPAACFVSDDGVAFGVIASDSESFCDACDRLRLTADGRLRGCLYESGGVDVGGAVRAGHHPSMLAAMITNAIDAKRSLHPSVPGVHVPFSMAEIGG